MSTIHIRQPYVPSSQQATTLPREIIWLRRGTLVLCGLFVVIVLGVAARAFVLSPWFALTKMEVTGDTQFHNPMTLRANVLPDLAGSYFTVNLRTAQAHFESLPWVRSAVVQRVFPNALTAHLIAHAPVTRWRSLETQKADGVDSEDPDMESLLNTQGEIFEVAGGQIDTRNLPALSGPIAAAAQVLDLYHLLQARLPASLGDISITALGITAQGLVRAKLSSGAQLELGSGSNADVMQRVEGWLGALPQIANKYSLQSLQSLDLRYPSGFAMRLSGITTRQKTKQSK